jgi:hypothetical protein
VLTPRDRLVPCAYWQVLDWGQFTPGELDVISPLRRAFRLPGDVSRDGTNWLEVVSFAAGSRCAELATLRQVWMGLRQSAAVSKRATDPVGVVIPQETSSGSAAIRIAAKGSRRCLIADGGGAGGSATAPARGASTPLRLSEAKGQ